MPRLLTPPDLPTWGACSRKAELRSYDKLTALEKFIFDQEPAGKEEESEFRTGLLAVLNEQMENFVW